MKIWAITDNKPGHQNQTAGLIQSLSQMRDAKIHWMPGLSFFGSLWALLSGRCPKVCDKKNAPPDLIIGAGHKTHMSLLALRRCCGGKSIVLMRPSLPLAWFDLCLIPRHDNPPKRDNVIKTVGAINRIRPSRVQRAKQAMVLLGGKSSHFEWSTQHVLSQLETLFHNYPDYDWLIASSRRTPQDCLELIQRRFPEHELVLPESVSEDWLPQHLQQATQIWVTQDSVSMIYEALTSGAKTGLIQLVNPAQKTRVSKEIQRLIAEQRVMTLTSTSASASAKTLQRHEPLDEANRCARLVLEKFNV